MRVPCVVAAAEFYSNWRALAGGAFDGLDWTNAFVAGGAVLGCLLPGFQGSGAHTDTHTPSMIRTHIPMHTQGQMELL